MGMNPKRAGGNLAYSLTERSLLTTGDVYGAATASMNPMGLVTGAAGAPASSFGSRSVTPVPPSLRGAATGQIVGKSGTIPVIGPMINNLPGGSAIHLLVWAVIAYIMLRLVLKEVD